MFIFFFLSVEWNLRNCLGNIFIVFLICDKRLIFMIISLKGLDLFIYNRFN